jgi:iron(III) transport system ATP-binding protein
VEDGSFFTLLGPSGCGKTTLLRTLAGFIQPDAGRIRFDRQDVTNVPVHLRNIGMVFQDYALFPDKTVFANVAYGLRARAVRGKELDRRVREQLERVGLDPFADRYPAELSGGQRQRTALARALVIKPRFLLMDEPLSNLDSKLRVAMRDIILDLQRASGITTVFVTHDQDEALSMSDRIAIMDRGAIVQAGSPQELYDAPPNGFVADFIGAANVLPVQVERLAADQQVAVNLAGFELLCANGGVQPGQPAKLIVRPEQLRLDFPGSEPDAGNVLLGRVSRRRYLGVRSIYSVQVGEGSSLVVEHRDGSNRPPIEVGQPVAIAVPTTSRVVVS